MSLKRAALLLGLVSSYSFAMDSTSVIKEVVVSKTDNSVLSIQNLSSTELLIDVYGKEFTIEPASGLSFECEGYSDLEIQRVFCVSCWSKCEHFIPLQIQNQPLK